MQTSPKIRQTWLVHLEIENSVSILAASQGTMAMHETGSNGGVWFGHSGLRKAVTSFPLIVHTVNALLPSIKRPMWTLSFQLFVCLLSISL